MSYTVLIIDDSEPTHIILKKLLEDEFSLVHAKSAQEGINIIAEKKVNLILSDIHMPGLSGLEFLESVMNDAGKKDIPILIMTNLPSVEKEKKALDLGAEDFIDKAQFYENVDEALNRIRMKLVTATWEPDLAEDLKFDKKKIAKILMSEAITGDFFTASRKLFVEILNAFGIGYLSFWIIEKSGPKLILSLGENQPPQYGADDLQQEPTFREFLEDQKPYLTNHVSEDGKGIMVSFSNENKFYSEIGIPVFNIDEKKLIKHKFNVPEGTPLFGYIVLKRGKLFSEKEYRLLTKLLMQSGSILWRLYNKI